MTRSKTKALKEALNALVLKVSTHSELKGPFIVSRGGPHTSYPCVCPIQPYLSHEVRTTKKTKESYYNLEITWVVTFSFCF